MFYYHYHPGIGILSSIFSIVIWVLLIALIVAIIRRLMWRDHMMHHRGHDMFRGGMWESNSAIDILKERYAKGEINKEEYEQKKKDLES